MKIRFGIRWRLGLVIVIGWLAFWLVMISLYYVAEGSGRATSLPTPGGLSALAKAVERTDAEDRALILTAMQTETRSVRVEPVALTDTTLPDLWPTDMATLQGYVRALEGRPLSVTPKEIEGPFSPRIASAFNAVEFRIGLEGGQTLVVQSKSPVVVAPLGFPVGFGAGFIALIIALFALYFLDRELRPLTEFAAALDRFDPEDEAPFVPNSRAHSPEIHSLTEAFGQLQERLATLTKARMALVGGIQHDLRSFATRLRLRVEQISDVDERRRAEADIEDMVSLLDDALIASRIYAEALDKELLEPFDIALAEVTDRKAGGANIELSASLEAQTATILADRLAFRRITSNLVDNALRYGSLARVDITIGDGLFVLSVDDDGPGIPVDQRSVLLEPFTRLETSRARATGGAGLGLAIVNRFVTAHGGDLSIKTSSMGGSSLIVEIPVFGPVPLKPGSN